MKLLRNAFLIALAGFSLATYAQSETTETKKPMPDNVRRIIEYTGKAVIYIQAIPRADGKSFGYVFLVPDVDGVRLVYVAVPSNCTPERFEAYATAAMDAVYYFHKAGIPRGQEVKNPPKILSDISKLKGVSFRGSVINDNETNIRWMFYVSPEVTHQPYGVVVNMASDDIQTVGQFWEVYSSALFAVQAYENGEKANDNNQQHEQQTDEQKTTTEAEVRL